MPIVLIIFVVLCPLLLCISWLLAGFTMTGHRQTIEEAMAWQSEHYDTSFYGKLDKTDYTVPGAGGYMLHVQLLKNPESSGKYVIISHGYTDNHIGSLKYAKIYLDLNFNCILYDLRGHEENEKTYTSYGVLEGQDLDCIVKDTRERYTDVEFLCLHGESLGASSTVASLKYRPKTDAVIADCGFSDIENVLREGYRKAHVPGFLFELADFGARIRYRTALKDMRPIDSLDENTVPVLFIHGADDDFILPRNAQDMYDRTKGPREIFFMPGAGHAASVLTNPEKYREVVEGFLQKYMGT